jgi:hypothetical protein
LKALPYFNFKQKIQNKSIWAGATGMQTQMASNNKLTTWILETFRI